MSLADRSLSPPLVNVASAPTVGAPASVSSWLVAGGTRVIVVWRNGDAVGAQALAAEVRRALVDGVPAVIVDVTELAALDSMVLCALVAAHKGLVAAGAALAVVCSPAVIAILRGQCLDSQLSVVGTLRGAMALVATPCA